MSLLVLGDCIRVSARQSILAQSARSFSVFSTRRAIGARPPAYHLDRSRPLPSTSPSSASSPHLRAPKGVAQARYIHGTSLQQKELGTTADVESQGAASPHEEEHGPEEAPNFQEMDDYVQEELAKVMRREQSASKDMNPDEPHGSKGLEADDDGFEEYEEGQEEDEDEDKDEENDDDDDDDDGDGKYGYEEMDIEDFMKEAENPEPVA